MWRKIYGVIRYSLKKIFVEPLTVLVSAGMLVVNCVKSVVKCAADTVTTIAGKAREAHIDKLGKLAVIRAMFLFLGGLICCFLFPDDACGDLTWFEKMLTTAKDWSGIAFCKCKDVATGWLVSKTIKREVNTT